MANLFTQLPIYVDTDMTQSFKTGLVAGAPYSQQGSFFIQRILFTVPGGTLTAGTITVSDGAPTPINLLSVTFASTAPMPIMWDLYKPMNWRDFKITGLTASGVAMQIWIS